MHPHFILKKKNGCAIIIVKGFNEMDAKYQEDSIAISAQQMLPSQANAAGNVHGGEIMKMMDATAGIAAQRHCHTNAVTARVDELEFRKPVRIGDYVTCRGRVVYVGRTSMEVFVTVESENLMTGERTIALTAFFTMVSLDENNAPAQVPQILPGEDEFSRKLFEIGRSRYKANKERINAHDKRRNGK